MPVRAHQNISPTKEIGHVIAEECACTDKEEKIYVPTEKTCCHSYSKLETANDHSILHY